jgi:hypothetical protein
MSLFLQQLGANSAWPSASQVADDGAKCRLLEGGHDVRSSMKPTSAAYDINVHSEALSTREFMAVLCDALGLSACPAAGTWRSSWCAK